MNMTPHIAEEIASMAVDTIMDTLRGGLADELARGRFLRRDDFEAAEDDIRRGVQEVWAKWEKAQQ